MSAADGAASASAARDDSADAASAAGGPGAARGSSTADGPGAPRIGMIWAQAHGGVIGAGGTMPWHLSEDLKHFKRTTAGAPVVMGRRTWESFPPRFRPLPGRTNIVISRDDAYTADGALRAASLEEALDLARAALAGGDGESRERHPGENCGQHADVLWVLGGGSIYAEAMPQADLLVVTEIDLEVDGDTLAPAIPSEFATISADPEQGWHEASNGLRYRILTYSR